MKKWLCLLIAFVIALSLVACNGNETEHKGEGSPTVQGTDAPSLETTDAPTEVPTEEPTEEPTEVPTEEPVEEVKPDVLQMVINSDGTVTNAVADGPAITSHGADKVISIEQKTGLNVAQLTGGSCVYNAQIGDYYGDMENGFLLEIYFKVDSLPSGDPYWGIAENCEGGGFGIYVMQNGKIHAEIQIDGKYQIVEDTKTVELGRWYHVVFGWDTDVVSLYVDGQLVSEYKTDFGVIGFPMNQTAQYLAIGGCCSAGSSGGQGMVGSIGMCNMYLGVYDAQQMAGLYSDLMK